MSDTQFIKARFRVRTFTSCALDYGTLTTININYISRVYENEDPLLLEMADGASIEVYEDDRDYVLSAMNDWVIV